MFALHGLRIRSPIPLPAPMYHGSALPDLTIHWGGECAVPDEPPEGVVLARYSFGRAFNYTHTETATGYTLRFHACCEFRIDRHRRTISVHRAPDTNPDLIPLLLVGRVAAFVLAMTGMCVLHASAVEYGGVALAFIGNQGAGKSTLAALLCAAGARLVTDDLLHLSLDGNGFRGFAGTSEIRLRPAAVALADAFPAAQVSPTADGRLGIQPEYTAISRPPLQALVIPFPSRTCQALRLERLASTSAFCSLLRYPTMRGWQVMEPIRSQFNAVGRVARSIPVYRAEIPWGPPFAPDLPTALIQGVLA